MLRKNEIIELEITAVSHEGNGIGRHDDGMVVFVPLTAVGDTARVKIAKVQKSLAYGILLEVLTPSPHRVEPDCSVFAQCGGCSLRHMSYEQELAVKTGWVRDNLRNIGGVELALDETIASPLTAGYRNKAQYPIRMVDGHIRAGFFAKRSHRLLPVQSCPLQPGFFADICDIVTNFMREFGVAPYDEQSHSGLVRHLFIRHAKATGQIMVCLVLSGNALPHSDILLARLLESYPAIASFCVNVNKARTNVILGTYTRTLYGTPYIEDILCGVRLRLSPHAFYQVNHDAAELLYKAALAYAEPQKSDTLLDLYCGAGAIGLSMAKAVGEVVGVESVPQAVEDAEHNARVNGIGNARFICADAARAVETLRAGQLTPSIVILDPPRKGADASVIRCVHDLAPGTVVYISCNSATLARDAKLFAGLGYRLHAARAVDLFPRTAHVEAVALFRRG